MKIEIEKELLETAYAMICGICMENNFDELSYVNQAVDIREKIKKVLSFTSHNSSYETPPTATSKSAEPTSDNGKRCKK